MKIVLTGGPSAGKTTIAEALVRAYWDRLSLVPESASLLFKGGFPRDSSPESIVCQQRAIYHVQNELEQSFVLKNPSHTLICDRGTLDGLAFWPLPENDFFEQMRSSKKQELSRYGWVIHLETAAQKAYKLNGIRKESYTEAKAIDDRLKRVWQDHPRTAIVPNHMDFSLKITHVLLAVKMILDQDPEEKIKNFLGIKSQLKT